MLFMTIGGLGDSRLSLLPWHEELTARKISFRHIDVYVTGKTGFQHRLDTLKSALDSADGPVYLIGQSAGGLAVLLASVDNPKIAGVIAASPAMPKGISPLGWPLVSVMWRYQLAILRSESIFVGENDYDWLISGEKLPPEIRDQLISGRQNISGREALELSMPWLQPRLGEVKVPTVLVCGTDDRWVNPTAHTKLFEKMRGKNDKPVLIKVPFAGHLPAHGRSYVAEQAIGTLLSISAV
jgi:alpha-beta hydrolase superfamily lysophospholipase